ELERTAGRRAVDGRVRSAGHVEVHTGRRDRPREGVERHVSDLSRAPHVAPEVASAEREVDAGVASARLTDQRRHPLAPELVAVAVEEDVGVLLDGEWAEELGVRR